MSAPKLLGLGVVGVCVAVGLFFATRPNATPVGDSPVTAESAVKLLDQGEAGAARLVEALKDDAAGVAVVKAVRERLSTADAAALAKPLFDGFVTAGPQTQAAILDLVPELARTPAAVERCREVVRAGLTAPATGTRLAAVRQALSPAVRVQADVVPLLKDAQPEVRHAALVAVGPVPDGTPPVVGTEELFGLLHDADAGVRQLTAQTLRARGLDWEQVSLARQLSHPDPAERLHLLTDLAAARGVADPGPWLERLSRDVDPAVRLGAARVAHEAKLKFTGWLDRLAAADPDATVRRWAAYYRAQQAVRAAGY